MKTKQNGQLRFAALRRVSTEQQEKVGESLRTQTLDITQRVDELGGSIVEWYGGTESATPGHEKKEVNRLIHDAKKGRFNAVIVAHPDRWSRDNTASREGLEVFRAHGIRFFAGGTEFDLFSPDHELFLGISAVVGQFHARNQALKSMRNRINRAKRGIPTGGKFPFGRIFVRSKDGQTGHWEVDEEKKRMIQDCAKRYLRGESMEELAKEYAVNHSNLNKVLTKVSGTHWQIEFNSDVFNIHETIEMQIPRLLDDKTIEDIRKRAKLNRTFNGKRVHEYLFSNMMSCAHCDAAMQGQTNRHTTRYYRSMCFKREKPCPGPEQKAWIQAEVIEDAVMRHLFETFGNPVAVQRAMEEATPNNEKIQEAMKRLEFVTNEIGRLKASRQRILDLVVKDKISEEDSETQLEKLKEREQQLNTEQGRLDDELAHIPSKESLKIVSKMIAGKFREYTNARVLAKKHRANRAFDEITYEEKRALCEMVFNGETADGRRMGVWITWDKTGKKWRYKIEGRLIDPDNAEGPLNKKWFQFDGAPIGQKALVAENALC